MCYYLEKCQSMPQFNSNHSKSLQKDLIAYDNLNLFRTTKLFSEEFESFQNDLKVKNDLKDLRKLSERSRSLRNKLKPKIAFRKI